MADQNVHLTSHPSGIGSRTGMFSTSQSTAGAAFFPSPQKIDVRFLSSGAVCRLADDVNALPLAAMHTKRPEMEYKYDLMVVRWCFVCSACAWPGWCNGATWQQRLWRGVGESAGKEIKGKIQNVTRDTTKSYSSVPLSVSSSQQSSALLFCFCSALRYGISQSNDSSASWKTAVQN